jgi:hypothetical protein
MRFLMHNCAIAPWVEVKMLLAKGNVGSKPARARRGVQGFLACVASALAYVLLVAVPTLAPAPAVAQFGGFGNIHIFIGGGGHWRGRHGHSRHSRRHQKDKDKDEPEEAVSPALPTSPSSPSSAAAANPPPPATPSAPPSPPAGARPEPRGPNFEPSK